MNGFSAADMSTAAANGHAEGYQAGYADSVKAYEAGKPAAAQEAVAWQVGDDFYTSEPLAIEGIQQWGPSGSIAIPLYAAPVTAAPVDAEELARNRYRPVPDGLIAYRVVAGDGTRSLFSGTKDACNIVARKLTEAFLDGAYVASAPAAPVVDPSRLGAAMKAFDDAGGHAVSYAPAWMRKALEAASTPAAPGIDAEQFREAVENLEWQNRGHANPDFPTGDPEKHAECLRLLALIDASPKGGSIAQFKGLTRELTKLSKKSEGEPVWIEPQEAAAILQATSAEVGA